MKKTFEQWVESASTSALEANLATPRNAYEAGEIRKELNRRAEGAAERDTQTLPLFPETKP